MLYICIILCTGIRTGSLESVKRESDSITSVYLPWRRVQDNSSSIRSNEIVAYDVGMCDYIECICVFIYT